MGRRLEGPSWLLFDLATYLASRARHLVGRAARDGLRRRRVARLLRHATEISGVVSTGRRIAAPLSGAAVAAYRIVVQQTLEDGERATILDETHAAELDLQLADGCARIDEPLWLVTLPGTPYPGHAVARALGSRLSAGEEDLRATEYLLVPGDRVHALGIGFAPGGRGGASPYRTTPPRLLRDAWVPAVVLSTLPRRELVEALRSHPELLPPR